MAALRDGPPSRAAAMGTWQTTARCDHRPGRAGSRTARPLEHMRMIEVSPGFYSARMRTEEICIRLIAGVELLTWVCQAAVCADAMPLDRMMK